MAIPFLEALPSEAPSFRWLNAHIEQSCFEISQHVDRAPIRVGDIWDVPAGWSEELDDQFEDLLSFCFSRANRHDFTVSGDQKADLIGIAKGGIRRCSRVMKDMREFESNNLFTDRPTDYRRAITERLGLHIEAYAGLYEDLPILPA